MIAADLSKEKIEETKTDAEEKAQPNETKAGIKIVVEEEGSSSDSESKTPETKPEITVSTPNSTSESSDTPSTEDGTNEMITEESESLSKSIFNKNTFFIILVVIIVIGLVIGGILVYKKALKKQASVNPSTAELTQENQTTPTEAPEGTQSGQLKKEELKLKVLNGSGKAGVASTAKAYLEKLGYKTVDTGNATKYDYLKTEIAIKDSKKEYLSQLIKDLEKEYKLATETGTLEKENQYDIVITLGKE